MILLNVYVKISQINNSKESINKNGSSLKMKVTHSNTLSEITQNKLKPNESKVFTKVRLGPKIEKRSTNYESHHNLFDFIWLEWCNYL